ncbi:prolyl oligopeptidase family serine peptidase [Myxococcota bacterium]|nr:prolyl oligopeptidase family serine peptidase [Myxococcota bacterium]
MHLLANRMTTAPSLLVYRDDPESAREKGTVLVYHGLGASKDIQSSDLVNLAQYGFLVVGIDNVGHGERRYPDFDQRFSEENPKRLENLLQAVLETATETPLVVDELAQQGLFLPGRLGIMGISMGGFITYRAVITEKRFSAAVPMLASPRWPLEQSASPHHFMNEFYPLPLLSLTAGADQTVPPLHTREFHAALGPHYAADPARLAYKEATGADHAMPQAAWNSHWLEMVRWFERWLTP